MPHFYKSNRRNKSDVWLSPFCLSAITGLTRYESKWGLESCKTVVSYSVKNYPHEKSLKRSVARFNKKDLMNMTIWSLCLNSCFDGLNGGYVRG